jgi:hypothetical protein
VPTRTVRLDEQSERLLAEIQKKSGLSVSEALKAGLVALDKALAQEHGVDAYAVYERLDLGPGGYARAPARKAKSAIRAHLVAKRRSDR